MQVKKIHIAVLPVSLFTDFEEVWEYEDAEEDVNNDFANSWEESPDFPLQEKHEEENSLVSWLVLFLLRLQSRFYLPDVAVSSLVKFLYAFLVILGTRSDYVARMVRSFPPSLYQIHKRWDRCGLHSVCCLSQMLQCLYEDC